MPHDPLDWIDEELETLEEHDLRRHLATRQGPASIAGKIVLNDLPLINFSSNDYLDLAGDQRLARAVTQTIERAGWGSGASPLVTGRASLHARLEEELADFENTDAALLFTSGYAANAATIPALVGRGDVIFSDAKNHASIIDGCRLSGARVEVFQHLDVDDLKERLRQSSDGRRRLIVTDTLFSMDGDLAPLADYAELAKQHEAMLMVDEAHATGVFGSGGRGVAEHLGVEDGIHVRIGTLSKALGSIGGFVAGSQALIDLLANRARAYVFSTATPEAAAAASLEALRIVREEPHRREELLTRAASFREQLKQRGWPLGEGISQIVSLVIGTAEETMHRSIALRQKGLLVPGIRPPTVPRGESLLRVSLSYAHHDDMVGELLDALGTFNR